LAYLPTPPARRICWAVGRRGSHATQTKEAAALDKARQAEKLLKSTRVLSPNLSGPEMVDKYKALLQRLAAVQGQPVPAEKKP
jgi:hypothetical protein